MKYRIKDEESLPVIARTPAVGGSAFGGKQSDRKSFWEMASPADGGLAMTVVFPLLVGVLTLAGCDAANMRDEARLKPYENNAFFADGRTARDLPEGTLARGTLKHDDHLYAGKVNGAYAKSFPFEITQDSLERGRERYNIFCSVCHDRTGMGQGMVVRRGFKAPRSFHSDRLRNMPAGEVFDIITEGRGSMPGYAHQIRAEDRWAIVAYIRALQLSQNKTPEDVPVEDRQALEDHESGAHHSTTKKTH